MNRRHYVIAWFLCVVGLAAWALVAVKAQKERLKYPEARKSEVVDDYHGTKVADPYRWMEDNPQTSPELMGWIKAERGVTDRYLASLPARQEFQKRITELWDYPKVSAPSFEGGALPGNYPLIFRHHLAGGAMQIARPAVIAQPLPGCQHVLF